MTKYTVASQRNARRVEKTISPMWRGVGCLMMLIVPVISYFLAVMTIQIAVAQNWPLPYQLIGYPVMPALLWKSAALAPIMGFIEAQQNLYAILLITVVYIVAIGTLVSFAYSLGYKFLGPPRYGPLDEPPGKVTPKRYTR